MSSPLVEALFAASSEAMDRWAVLLDPSVHLRIGNRRPAVALTPALRELGRFLCGVEAVGGQYREVWELRDAVWVETEIRCRFGGGSPPVIPCAVAFRTGGRPLALDVRFYCDPTPVFARRGDGLEHSAAA